jgi:hypothetical protein
LLDGAFRGQKGGDPPTRESGRRSSAISAILAGLEQRIDLIVIPQETNEQVRWPVLKDKAQRDIAATLKNLVAQFANPQATMHVGAAKGFRQLAQR